jgi:Skp family chaperone for outer membrane proteins
MVGGLATVAACYLVSRLAAQTPAPTSTVVASPAQVRVAFVNIELIFSKYEKAKVYKDEVEKALEPFKVQIEKLKKEIIIWQEDMKKPTFKESERERYDLAITKNKRDYEDLTRQAGKLVGKKNEEQVVQLYREVSDAIQRYALSNGFHAVLAYGNPLQVDPMSYPSIVRIVQGMEQTGCLSLMYSAPGLDISGPIVDSLNSNYRTTAATSTNSAPAATGAVTPAAGRQ